MHFGGRRVGVLSAVLVLSFACRRHPSTAATPAGEGAQATAPAEKLPPATAARVADLRTQNPNGQLVRGARVSTNQSEEAIRAWRPDRAAVEGGGECQSFPMPMPGVRTLSVQFPSRAKPEGTVSITVDSLGRLLRYSDNRGARNVRIPANATAAQRDSAIAADNARMRRTSISLDFASGMGIAVNQGGDLPDDAVSSHVTVFNTHQQFGSPAKRIEQVTAICKAAGLK